MKRILIIYVLISFFVAEPFAQNTWTTPINVGTRWNSSPPIMEEVNGFPAIVHRSLGRDVMFVRALDACGDTWDTPINVSSLYIPDMNTYSHPEMIIVDGHPAITFQDSDNANFIYCRADDPDGSSWTQFQIIDSGSARGRLSRMLIVNGRPAIFYSDQSLSNGSCSGNIFYKRANDAQGSSWGARVTVISDQCNYWGPNDMFVEILNGNPSLAGQLKINGISGAYFIRASDVDGATWPSAQLVYDDGWCYGMTVVDNKPNVLVLFQNSTTFIDSLGISESNDNLGASWPQTLEKLDFGGSDIYDGLMHQFDNKVWVSAGISDSPDSLVYISSANTAPLNFGPKEFVIDTSGFFVTHELNSICGELAVSFQYVYYYYMRTISPALYYEDFDGDGFGNPNVSLLSSTPVSGYVLNDIDCDDTDPNITHPGAACDDGIACTFGTSLQADCTCANPTSVNSVTNTYIGTNDQWMLASNWSLNTIPEICHDVIIPAGKTVRILSGAYAICHTLEVHTSSIFRVEANGTIDVITSGN